MTPGKIITAVLASIIGLVSIGLLFGGGALLWAYGTQRDTDGFILSPQLELGATGYAVTSSELTLTAGPGDWWPFDPIEVRIEADPVDRPSVFVGIGPSDEVGEYLDDVAYSEVTRIQGREVTYRSFEGGAPAVPPGEEDFWTASIEGPGTQVLSWGLEPGEWTVVVMNPDLAAGVSADMRGGARMELLLAIGFGLLAGGLILGGLAAALLVWATRSRVSAAAPAASAPGYPVAPVAAGAPGAPAYPVRLEGDLDPTLSRWMWLVKWLLAVPHFIMLTFLWTAFFLLTIVAFFSIVFTGRYPRGIFDFNVGVLRWTWRVGFYTTSVLGTDRYPPFTLAETDYPAHLDVEYPERLSPGLALVKWWLLAIPHYLVVGVLTSGLVWWTTELGDENAVLRSGGGLIGLLAFIAVIVLAFTGRYPRPLFDLLMGLNRWVFRVAAYAALMRDEYPPFRLDQGATEPKLETTAGVGGPPVAEGGTAGHDEGA